MTEGDCLPSGAPLPPDNPTILFEEYVLSVGDGGTPDVAALLARAGARRNELEQLLRMYGTLEHVRRGTTGGALPDDLRGAGSVAENLTQLGRYTILSPLGRGGLSCVYLAQDSQLQRPVALKVLTAPLVDAGGAHAWILNEGRSVARLEHPGVVRVFEVGEADGLAFISMEHVKGPSLREVLRGLRELAGTPEDGAERVSDEARAAARDLQALTARTALVAQIAEALAYCHANGVIHRDIKPANVLVTNGAQPVLIDFGLAHLESSDGLSTEITQRLVGTPAYIAPEQIENNRTGASEQSDQFSLGVLLTELLTLRSPFARETRTETLQAVTRAEPPRPRSLDPDIPPDLERICLHALQREPHERYSRVVNLADDLRAFLAHRAISLQPPTLARVTSLWLRRNRRGVRIGVSVALALLILFGCERFVQLRRARSALLPKLDAITSTLHERRLPSEFSNAYMGLVELRNRATEVDDALFAALLFPPLETRVRQAIDDCSKRLGELLAERRRAIEAGDDSDSSAAERGTLLRQWSAVLKLDEFACRDCPYNVELRQYGSVELPASSPERPLRLFRHVPVPSYPVALLLEPVSDMRNLEPGVYRLLQQAAGASDPLDFTELDFVLRYEDPRWTVEQAPLLAPLRARFVCCPGGAVTMDYGEGSVRIAARSVVVEPFAITAGLITWRDVADVHGLEDVQGRMTTYENIVRLALPKAVDAGWHAQLDDPAVLSGPAAQAFATECGARLPTLLECRVAQDTLQLPLPDNAKLADAEWTSGLSEKGTERYAAKFRLESGASWNTWARALSEDGFVPDITFRLARSRPSLP